MLKIDLLTGFFALCVRNPRHSCADLAIESNPFD